MFEKILIANRGEIACRIAKSARKMGIKTVAVYSEADRDALHVLSADEGVLIGPAPSSQSYLQAERILQACKDTGAQAVHPGYGFLSENSAFCEALAAAGIAFIGPKTRAIEAMGDKITSKKLAEAAGVNTIPGFTGVVEGAEHAVQISQGIGYPVMLKASAGGGGKGMRIARNDAECRDGFERATNEARSSFGDDRVFIEKFIEEPRHIEIQVLGDSHGNVVYLAERECSLQRRHQKVIEEAPSSFLDDSTRRAMGEQAVLLAKAVDYESAGTVEFIVDSDRNFFFLEMNTRLQVEHPVTEYITGLDLVEWMIRVANGEPLGFSQDDIRINGWAIESRIYAEDPFRNFLPSVGRLVHYEPSPESECVRVDTGVYEGGEVSMYYDPMIAKLVTYGQTRAEATDRMVHALDEFVIRGVSHNISFLQALLVHPRFREGRISTNTIAEEYPGGFHPSDAPMDDPAIPVAVAGCLHRIYMNRSASLGGQLAGHERVIRDDWAAVLDGKRWAITVLPAASGFEVEVDGERYAVSTNWRPGEIRLRARINNAHHNFQVQRHGVGYRIFHHGSQTDVLVLTPRAADLHRLMPKKEAPDLSKFLLSPMPGLLTRVSVEAGQDVKQGQELAVVEAMKMENTLRAERDGVVAKILTEAGASLAVDQAIIEFQ